MSASFLHSGLLLKGKQDWRLPTAALALAASLAWLAWPLSRPTILGRHGSVEAMPMFQGLQALPELQRLQSAGALPAEAGMKRDLFLFEGPQPPRSALPAILPTLSVEPPDATVLARDAELATAPKALRYLGFLRGTPAGLIGAFMRGDEPVTLQPGSEQAGWRLLEVGESAAVFQSLRFPDLRFTLLAKEAS